VSNANGSTRIARRDGGWVGQGLLLAALLVLAPLAARAQEPAPTPEPTPEPAAAPEGSNAQFAEEITVSARKMGEENAQDVPVSVSATSEETLRNRGASTIEDVAANTAGFTVQSLGPGQSQVAMRGVSAGQIVRDQPGVKEQVGVYLDESAISLSLYTPDLDLFDLSRVEVLRGPQGTVFGAGSLSGTVRYITNQPELGRSEAVGEFTLTSASGGGMGGAGKVAVNEPLGDTTALRVTAYYDGYGGFIDAKGPSNTIEDVNDGSRAGARIALRAQPNESFTITPRIVYQKVDMNGWNRQDIYNILGNDFTTTRPRVHLGDRDQYTQIEEPVTDKFLLADLNAAYEINSGLTLTSITSYIHRDIDVLRDATALTASVTGDSFGLPENVYTIDAPLRDVTTSKAWTEELRLSGGAERFHWVGGLFYADSKRDYGQDLNVHGYARLVPRSSPFYTTNEHLYFSDLHYKLQQTAVFGEGTLAVGDRLDLSGGVRYYDFDEDRTLLFSGLFAEANNTKGSVSADGFAPRLIASFKLNEGTRLNAQVSKGFRLGGINDPANIPICNAQEAALSRGHDRFDDETAWNYEVGTKSTVMGGRATINIAAYYMKIQDLQVPVDLGSCSSRLVFNVPDAKNQGLELEINASPSSSFDISLSASYNDGEVQSSLIDNTGAVIGGIRKGNRLPTVPKLQYSASATYQWPVHVEWLGFVNGTYQHVGSRFTRLADEEPGVGIVRLRQGIGGPLTQSTFTFDPELAAYDVLNLRLGLIREKVEFAFFVNNATDELAQLALDRERGLTARVGYLVNEPRTFGVTTRVHF
jgi:iron complex outermembrane receptor protein